MKEKGLVSRGETKTPTGETRKMEKEASRLLTIHLGQFQRVRGAKKEWVELYNDPWCTVQLLWEGGGSGVVVAFHPVPAVTLDLLQCGVHCSSHNAASNTHTISLITARAGSTDSRATLAPCAGIPLQAKPTGAACWTEIAEIDRQTGSQSVQGGLTQRCCRARISTMCANLTVYLLGLWQKCTILPLFRESPFSMHSIRALFTIPATGKHTPFVLSHSIHKLP